MCILVPRKRSTFWQGGPAALGAGCHWEVHVIRLALWRAIGAEHQDLPIDQLGLSTRTRHTLLRAQIYTVGELLEWDDQELTLISGFGPHSFNELRRVMTQLYEDAQIVRVAGTESRVTTPRTGYS
ncbi:DNA-directed RNA polymerase subunit alpha C-terminal domain-containing protein (plasmid) [Streptosporangium sp. CA-135522]|uniref:DNA-directed RNA polymerase subunit alpha C-terminal domain-containing protein n=1 Tax=Streptosporangium sp. CA-135522 TaxID=3240072 RepID=UPI003D8FBD74